ncbi:hypothetical protein [Streptomyces sp. NBC_01294]|uniref:hypothetical protein n=1 Tax=Streptomyces sp. NBC_01294 TaxID=2903815 RepID=UPI002DDB1C8E|nr:hypothetical protein [Streptomyces sp. NBC_01294]WRZ59403.1 hypothetical protein OG534_24705 [Streptomyces sp. NBC_01294]
MDDPTEYSKIKTWVDEWGGDLDYVDYVKGNGDLALLAAFSLVFWPRFVEVQGCVLWDRVYEKSNFADWYENCSGDTRKIEMTLNRLRVWQLVESRDVEEDSQALKFAAERIARAWRAALYVEFPGRDFVVGVDDSEDGPIVTFASASQ